METRGYANIKKHKSIKALKLKRLEKNDWFSWYLKNVDKRIEWGVTDN